MAAPRQGLGDLFALPLGQPAEVLRKILRHKIKGIAAHRAKARDDPLSRYVLVEFFLRKTKSGKLYKALSVGDLRDLFADLSARLEERLLPLP